MSNISNIGGPQGVPQKRLDITESKSPASGQAEQGEQAASDAQSAAKPVADQVDIHEDAILLAKAREAFDNTSDVREDRIADVKAKLAAGFYDSPEVVESLAEGLARGFRA
ncbi:MAG: flagellar biosynthesis anti-sigma factor FlgM [Planctomycetota bacterium]|jgi:anti-sigma28 factor (negative regulator of flagellin synthesis)|nr:flagellar biosynthesis anti-sigma factor FlgM [Planctomycetota bacterium]